MANLGAGAGIEAVARDIAIGKEIRSEKDLFGQVSELGGRVSTVSSSFVSGACP